MTIQYLEGKHRFYVPGLAGEPDVAEVTFQREGDNIGIIDHIYVNPNYRGQGIAEHLFELAVEKLKQEGRKIIPVCSYAKVQFERKTHLQHLLVKE
ncbi:GNAT family N-acetyltransferase [Zophobihabitans entericus]|uniref:N-acetyltransferase n=1 Tax=Zophobihabitans entericus TaxID=1635327 RepID=A0A6G9I7V0_9GAMM|nr:GNAT family N-acetyltransferase [Zophobihabitans entericus]QIQ20285.1 N-acetyltransferase [Zophobihabitans entericus]